MQNTGCDVHFLVAEFQVMFFGTQHFLDSNRLVLTELAYLVKESLAEFITNIYFSLCIFPKPEIHHAIFLLSKMARHLREKSTVCA